MWWRVATTNHNTRRFKTQNILIMITNLKAEVTNAAVNWHINSIVKNLNNLQKEMEHGHELPEEMRLKLQELDKDIHSLELDYYLYVSDKLEEGYESEKQKIQRREWDW